MPLDQERDTEIRRLKTTPPSDNNSHSCIRTLQIQTWTSADVFHSGTYATPAATADRSGPTNLCSCILRMPRKWPALASHSVFCPCDRNTDRPYMGNPGPYCRVVLPTLHYPTKHRGGDDISNDSSSFFDQTLAPAGPAGPALVEVAPSPHPVPLTFSSGPR